MATPRRVATRRPIIRGRTLYRWIRHDMRACSKQAQRFIGISPEIALARLQVPTHGATFGMYSQEERDFVWLRRKLSYGGTSLSQFSSLPEVRRVALRRFRAFQRRKVL